MRLKVLASVAALGAAAAISHGARAAPLSDLAVFDTSPAPPMAADQLLEAQYFWGGRNWCWYFDGWRGPGYYWCGYAFRRGYGWGGPAGWRGWGWRGRGPDGGFRGAGFRGGPGGRFGGDRGGHGAFGGGGHEAFAGHGGGHDGGGHGGGGHGDGGHHR